ncbi:MAG: histidine phosphatase family protein [Candidatus Omnitrophota bacterium]
MRTRLILIRHGVTAWNASKKYCGYKDVPLNTEGNKQARKLRKRLSAIPIDAVYSSDLKRAVTTARIAMGGRKITRVRELREINFGALEGLDHAQIMKKYPIPYTKWLKYPLKKHSLPGAESMSAFRRRVSRAIKKILAENRGKTVAIFCHGGTISVFFTAILKKNAFWRYVPGSTSVSILEFQGNKPAIKLFNCTKHLR